MADEDAGIDFDTKVATQAIDHWVRPDIVRRYGDDGPLATLKAFQVLFAPDGTPTVQLEDEITTELYARLPTGRPADLTDPEWRNRVDPSTVEERLPERFASYTHILCRLIGADWQCSFNFQKQSDRLEREPYTILTPVDYVGWLHEAEPETVVFCGAGLIRFLQEGNGVSPPLAADLFKVAYEYHAYHPLEVMGDIAALLSWLRRYFQLSEPELRSRTDVPIEEIFTLLQRHAAGGNHGAMEAYHQLNSILVELLVDINLRWLQGASNDISGHRVWDVISAFGAFLIRNQTAQVTLNYDGFLEEIIERAMPPSYSMMRRPDPRQPPSVYPEAGKVYGLSSYELPLAYGFQVNEIRPTTPPGPTDSIPGPRFYAERNRNLYTRPLLKLHGSLNWLTSDPASERPRVRLEQSIGLLARFSEPLIITPLQHKNYTKWPFPEIWRQASEILTSCRRLIVIGYSFPETDFEVRRLLREARADNPLDELVVVNPNDSDIGKAASIINCDKRSKYHSLVEFLTAEGLLFESEQRAT